MSHANNIRLDLQNNSDENNQSENQRIVYIDHSYGPFRDCALMEHDTDHLISKIKNIRTDLQFWSKHDYRTTVVLVPDVTSSQLSKIKKHYKLFHVDIMQFHEALRTNSSRRRSKLQAQSIADKEAVRLGTRVWKQAQVQSSWLPDNELVRQNDILTRKANEMYETDNQNGHVAHTSRVFRNTNRVYSIQDTVPEVMMIEKRAAQIDRRKKKRSKKKRQSRKSNESANKSMGPHRVSTKAHSRDRRRSRSRGY